MLYKRELLGYYVMTIVVVVILVVAKFVLNNDVDRRDVIVVPKELDTLSCDGYYDSLHINTAGARQLKKFGFRNWEIVNILSYREAGGKIRSWERLSNIYGVDTINIISRRNLIVYDDFVVNDNVKLYSSKDSDWKRASRHLARRVSLFYADSIDVVGAGVSLAIWDSLIYYRNNYILRGSIGLDTLVRVSVNEFHDLIRPHLGELKRKPLPKEQSEVLVVSVELNGATNEELCRLRGIKETTAKAIVDYRERLGGFVEMAQLKDIWCIDSDERYMEIEKCLTIDRSRIRKIRVNDSSVKALQRHPYSNKRLTSALFRDKASGKGAEIKNVEQFRQKYGWTNYDMRLEEYLYFGD